MEKISFPSTDMKNDKTGCVTSARLILTCMVWCATLAVWNATPTAVDIKVLCIRVCAAAAALLLLLDCAVRRRIPGIPVSAAAAGGALCAYWAVRSALGPYSDFDSFSPLCVGLVVFFTAASVFGSKSHIDDFILAWLCVSIPVSVYFMAQRAGFDFIRWDAAALIPKGSTFTNRAHLMYFLLCTWPFGAYLFLTSRGKRRMAAAASLILALACIAFGGGRAEAGITVLTVPFVLLFLRSLNVSPAARRALGIAAAGAGCLCAAGIAWAAATAARLDYPALSNLTGYRLNMWESARAMAAAKPLFGFGPSGFERLWPQYKLPLAGIAFGHTAPLVHCHNEYLETLVDTGIAGLTLFCAFIAIAVANGLPRAGTDTGRRALFFFSSVACSSLLAFSTVSVAPRYLYCQVFLWLTLALCHTSAGMPPAKRAAGRAAQAALWCLLAAYTAAAGWFSARSFRSFLSQVELKQALIAGPSKSLRAAALARCDATLALDSRNVGALYQKAYLQTLSGSLDPALATYDRMQRIHPYFQNVQYNRGMIHYRKGEFADAIIQLRMALDIYPEFFDAMLHLAESCYYSRRYAECVEWCDRILTYRPGHEKAAFLKKFVSGKYLPPHDDEEGAVWE